MTKHITPLAERMHYAEKILKGEMTTKEVSAKTGRLTSVIAGWCKTYAKGRVAHTKFKSWYGLLSNGAVTDPRGRKPNVSIKRGNEWSITVGEYRLTLSGIKEPEAVLLEKI